MKHLIAPLFRRNALPIIAILAVCICVGKASGQEPEKEQTLRYPIPCYEGDELGKIRGWEKEWTGKKVNSSNIDQVKELIPEPLYGIVKEPKKWGAEELWFTIAPYRPCPVSQGYIEATKKHSPMSKLDENEFLVGWDKGELAGLPFPKPKTGIEMAWNYDSVTHGDAHKFDHLSVSVKAGEGSQERNGSQITTNGYFTGRTDIPPLPRIVPNKRKLRKASLFVMKEPPETYGMAFLSLRHLNPQKEDDSYAWMSTFRRVIKSPPSARKESLGGGGDSLREEGFGWDAHINRNWYRSLGRKEILAARHQDLSVLERKKGQVIRNGRQVERVKAYVVEVTPKDAGYAYSKQVWYLDPETWLMLYKVNWNQDGKEWRFGLFNNSPVKGYNGAEFCYPITNTYVDLLSPHGGLMIRSQAEFGIRVPDKYFTLHNLEREGF